MPENAGPDAVRVDMKLKTHRDALLTDISALTAMPFPNLLYRVLADEPGRLESCWQKVRPGLVLVGAGRIRERLSAGQSAVGTLPTPPQHLSEERQRNLRDILDVYDAGNACNAVLITLMLQGSPGNTQSLLLQSSPVKGCPVLGRELLPMLEMGTMSDTVRAQVLRLARMVNPGRETIPSVFRHLANDRDLLNNAEVVIQDTFRNGTIDRLYRQFTAAVADIVSEWPVPVDPVTDPGTRTLLTPFASTIPRMLAVCAALRPISGTAAQI